MPQATHHLPELAATAALASSIARLLRPGDVLLLDGPLGAGKTTLTRALAVALGVDPALVSSPTFVFINHYPVSSGSLAGGELLHIDAYRLATAEDTQSLGWDALFDPVSGIALGRRAAIIEWPSRIAEVLPADPARLDLRAVGATAREATLTLPDSWITREGARELLERPPTRCRRSGRWVEPLAPTYPFADAKSRDADLFGWLSSSYTTSRPLQPDDLPDEQDPDSPDVPPGTPRPR